MAILVELDGRRPSVAAAAWLAPTATLIGEVEVAEGASVWFGTVLRGDFESIRVGRGACVQDNAVVHCAAGLPTLVGENVTVGHMAMLEGCVIEDGALVGMGAIVLQRARVGRGAMVAAGSVVAEGAEIPAGTLAAGAPAKVKKELAGSSAGWVQSAAREYQALVERYRTGARRVEP
ncbi:MAG: gamma carbonic anhydrase family protein [Solirubrobacterales bacterium]|nr:gamma carbonic anhydrase family protein [Solirubrobacterales bacterium]MBV9473667.1 gamma carbonic anhydrase family protein [Solirubrobacterales bacterium]MBV9836977.1 gamma carbonic anhydrase family protein [Solirubrobacterales bacterium]